MVSLRGGTDKVRSYLRWGGLTSPLVFTVHNNNLMNILRGLRERVFAVERDGELHQPPKPKAGAFNKLSQFRVRLFRVLNHCNPFTYQEFIDTYQGSKRTRYEMAYDSLVSCSLTIRDATLKTFVKAEKINLSKKVDPAPRVIQPRDPRYNLSVGRYIKPLEHKLYAAIGRLFEGPTVMKGYNAEQVASHIVRKWGKFRRPVAIGLDASRFDQHVSKDALEWEHSVYNGICKSGELARLLRWQIDNHGVCYTEEAKIKYKVQGCRMSGDMNTALGNCLLMCAMVWTFLQELGVYGELVNNGDDCVLFVEEQSVQRVMDRLPSWFLDMGFTMKVEEPVSNINKVEFCQTNPICVNGTWVMVRNPIVAMAKDTMCIKPNHSSLVPSYYSWCSAVGKCGMSLCGGVPVMQDFYQRMIELGRPTKGVQGFGDMSTGFEFLARNMHRQYTSITAQTRYQFWEAFGITPDMQEALESAIREVDDPSLVLRMMTDEQIEPIVQTI